MTRRALFRLDAGARIGLGHAIRCLALAEELKARGWSCRFAVNQGARAVVEAVAPVEVEIVEGEAFDDPAELEAVAADGCDALIVDHYGLDARFEKACRSFAPKIVAIDDLADREHDADALFDATYGRAAKDYAKLLPKGTPVRTGPAYALLAPGFARARAASLLRRASGEGVRRVLVSLGGAPPASFLRRLALGARDALPEAHIDIAAGASEGTLAFDDPKVAVHRGRVDMVGLTAAADLAIGAGGGSAWERCCLGAPSVLIEIADNQKAVTRALDDAGAGVRAGRFEAVGRSALAEIVAGLAKDGARLSVMSSTAAQLCDGLGARRIAGMIEALVEADGPRVTLRPATFEDSDVMLKQQQAPGVRKFSKVKSAPKKDEHEAWLRARLEDPLAGPFEIIEADGAPAGVLRFDRLPGPEDAYRVSILVDPRLHGRGVAGRALAAGRRLMAGSTLVAEVLEGNEPSHALFQRAGFARAAKEEYRLEAS